MNSRVGIIGMHGFSRVHIETFLRLQREGSCQLSAVVAHQREVDPEYAASLESSGIALVSSIDELLAMDLDLVTAPVGVHLHLPVVEACVAAGRHLLLEKPAATTREELQRMIALESRAKSMVMVGFQDLFLPSLHEVKRRILEGRIGTIRKIIVTVGWPRPKTYYTRNDWAGRLYHRGFPVRDSVAGNACAHFIMVAMFLAGSSPEGMAEINDFTADLARGNDIETFDTAFLEITTPECVRILLNITHLNEKEFGPAIRVEGDFGQVSTANLMAEEPWIFSNGQAIPVGERLHLSYKNALRSIRGESVPVCRLSQAQAHTDVIELCHAGIPVRTLDGCVDVGHQVVLPGLQEALVSAHHQGCRWKDCWSSCGAAPIH